MLACLAPAWLAIAGPAHAQTAVAARSADGGVADDSRAGALALRVVGSGHTAPLRRAALSPDQRTLVTVGDDRSARVWDVPERRLLQTLWPAPPSDDGGRLYGVAFAPRGDAFVVAGDAPDGPGRANRLFVYDAASGRPLRTLALPVGQVRRLLWTRDGERIASCTIEPARVVVVAARDGAVQFERSLDGPCYALAELPDGTLLAGDGAGSVRRIRTADGAWRELDAWPTGGTRVWSIAPAPDGRHVAVGFIDEPSNRATRGVARVEVLETAAGRVARSFTFPSIPIGDLRAVAWSADGRRIFAAGGAQRRAGAFVAMLFGWPGGDREESVLGTDSISDALPFGEAGFVLAHADSRWSVVGADGAGAPRIEAGVARAAADLRGPSNLRLAPDARAVGFALRDGEDPVEFSLPARTLAPGRSAHDGPTHSTWRIGTSGWQDGRRPVIGGRVLDLGPIDVSRAIAIAPDAGAIYVGTNQTLRRLNPDGAQAWSVTPGVETRAVNVSGDGRIVVSAMVDGTIRWWRARDGRALLTLYVQLDGRWVVWTDGGYYDSAPGAERLVGFLAGRRDGTGTDFFSIDRFRDSRYRPDVIDAVLATLDPAQALADADARRRAQAQSVQDEAVKVAILASATPAVVSIQSIAPARVESRPLVLPPPVVVLASPRRVQPREREVTLEFFLRALGEQASGVQVRVDGRPAEISRTRMPSRQDGAAFGEVSLRLPEGASRITLMAQAGERTSEPIEVDVEWPAALAPVAAVAPSPSAAPAPSPSAVPVPSASAAPAPSPSASPAPSPSAAPAPSPSAAPAPSPSAVPAPRANAAATPNSSATPAPSPSATPPPAARVVPAPASSPPVLTGPPRPRLFVLSIGVSRYQRRDYGDLRYAAKDAEDFAAALGRQEGRLYGTVQTRLLTDTRATRAAILEGLAWLRGAVGASDTAIVFLAGHGINDAAGFFHFLSHDADAAQPSRTAVGEADLRGALTALRGRVLLFADTCHAGGVVGSGAAASNEFTRMANVLSSPESGVVVFASATRQQEALERRDDRNGLFTKVLLEGLAGGADLLRQGAVTHQGLAYFIAQTVRQRTQGRQTPVYISPFGTVDYSLVAL